MSRIAPATVSPRKVDESSLDDEAPKAKAQPAVVKNDTGDNDSYTPAKAVPVSLNGDGVAAPRPPNAASDVNGPRPLTTAAPVEEKPTTYPGGIDRQRFLAELQRNPALLQRMAHMVNGEVGREAPLSSRIAILETAFNRAQVRGHSLEQALWSVAQHGNRGYYASDTYRASAAPSAAELEQFKKTVLAPVLAGSDVTSYAGQGPMTGNASGSVAAHQRGRGTPGYGMRIAGGQTEWLFNEEHKDLRNSRYLPRLTPETADRAAREAKAAIPEGVLPVADDMRAVTGGTSRREAVQQYGTGEVGHRGRTRHKRIFNSPDVHAPAPRAPSAPPGMPPPSNALMALLGAMGLSHEQVMQLLQAMSVDPGFQTFLNNREATPDLVAQYLSQNPERVQSLLTGTPTLMRPIEFPRMLAA